MQHWMWEALNAFSMWKDVFSIVPSCYLSKRERNRDNFFFEARVNHKESPCFCTGCEINFEKLTWLLFLLFLLKTTKGLFRLICVCADRPQGTSAEDLRGEGLELYLTSTRPHLGWLRTALWLNNCSVYPSLCRSAVLLGHHHTAPQQQTHVLLHQNQFPSCWYPLFL